MSAEGELTPATGEAACRRMGEAIRAAGVQVGALATALFWQSHYTAPDEAQRAAARELTLAGLERARWLGADALLVVPGIVRREAEPRRLVCAYARALTLAFEALRGLLGAAERCGVVMALENVWNGLFLSPVELAGFIDRLNSPWAGAYLDIGNLLKFGVPEDWIATLGRRIIRVHVKDYRVAAGTSAGFVPPGDGDADWPAIMAALRAAGYDGPLTVEGRGDPADLSRRIDIILAAR